MKLADLTRFLRSIDVIALIFQLNDVDSENEVGDSILSKPSSSINARLTDQLFWSAGLFI